MSGGWGGLWLAALAVLNSIMAVEISISSCPICQPQRWEVHGWFKEGKSYYSADVQVMLRWRCWFSSPPSPVRGEAANPECVTGGYVGAGR